MSTVGPSFFISALSVQKEKWKMCIFIFWIWPRQTHTKTRRGTRKKCNNHFGKETHFLREKYEREKLEHLIEVTSTSAASSLHFGSPAEFGGKWRSVPSGVRSNPKSQYKFRSIYVVVESMLEAEAKHEITRCTKWHTNNTHTHAHDPLVDYITPLWSFAVYVTSGIRASFRRNRGRIKVIDANRIFKVTRTHPAIKCK